MNGPADFSLEQAEVLNRFFGHSTDEGLFFLLLIQKERAGTAALKQVFHKQIEDTVARRLILVQRLGEKAKLTEEHRSIYYSSWQYGAVHIAVTIPGLRTRDRLSRFLNIPIERISEILEFLTTAGLAAKDARGYSPGVAQIRIGRDSPHIVKHHTHWRTQAIESLERETPSDLHYSAVVSLSYDDAIRIKNRILDEIRDNQAIVRDSREEEIYAYNIDFFSLKRTVES